MDRNSLEAAAWEALWHLGEARQEWVGTALALVEAGRKLKLAEAQARQCITEEAGGVKALGSNAELREYAMTIALAVSPGYLGALAEQDRAFEREARAKQAMYTLNDMLKLFRVSLETYTDPLERFHIGG